MDRFTYGWLLSALVALSGCAASGPSADELKARAEARQEALQDILTTPLSAEDYGNDEERCLSNYAYRSVDVLDDQHVLFKGSGDRMWLNKLRHRCVGLRPNEILQFEVRNSRVCDLDSFQAMDRFLMAARVSGTCTLGTFMPVTPEQVEAIELAFKE